MPEISKSKYLVQAGWEHVPHLDEQTKADLLASTPPHLRDARTKGIPSLGAGAIYPIELSEVLVDPFQLPPYWPRAYALDVGWNRTAALWGAWDRSVDCVYLYTEHYRGQAEPSIHASAIKARGDWIPGVIDPGARGRSQDDGTQLMAQYQALGLHLQNAENAIEAGIYAVWERLSTGRLKVFKTLQNWQAEYRLYRRDENGKIVKEFDHLMDCFHPDTPVWTDHGRFPIRDLPETGRVLTVGGEYAPYRHCGIVSRNARVVRVEFSDGSTITCTQDHLFLTPGGWVRADELAGHACYDAVSQSIHASSPCTLPSYPKPSRNFRDFATTVVASISSAMASAFTVLSGKACMVALSPTGSTSIIGTRTNPTISRTTSNSSAPASICPTTTRAIRGASHQMRSKLPRSGMPRPKDWNGIGSTIRMWRTSCTSLISSSVSSVVSNFRPCGAAPTASARTPARARGDAPAAQTPKIGRVSSAEARSGRAGIPRPRPAAESALPRCVRVNPAGRSDVYCLEVPSTRAFAVGDRGLIVHNCTRYLVLGVREIAKCMPVPSDRQMIGSANRGDPTAGI